MPASPLTDLSRCAIHTATNKPWSLRQCIEGYASIGIKGISVWRNALEAARSPRIRKDAPRCGDDRASAGARRILSRSGRTSPEGGGRREPHVRG